MAEGYEGKNRSRGPPAVFVSYASQDTAVANSIVGALEKAGIRCWIAPRDVVPGDLYADAIVRAIDVAPVVVLTLSQSAAASPHVLREVERASSKRHPIVAFRVDRAPLPAALEYFLNLSQWLDASAEHTEPALHRLVDAVRHATTQARDRAHAQPQGPRGPSGPRASSHPTTAASRSYPKRAVIIVTAVAVLVGVYALLDRAWLSRRVTTARQANGAMTAAEDKSIAVLPFVDTSEHGDQGYFADGIAEEMVNVLARIPQLRVIGRVSSFQFKGQREDLSTIGEKLGATYILQGSVRRGGTQIRVSAQLVDARTHTQLWAESYDREIGDVLALP